MQVEVERGSLWTNACIYEMTDYSFLGLGAALLGATPEADVSLGRGTLVRFPGSDYWPQDPHRFPSWGSTWECGVRR